MKARGVWAALVVAAVLVGGCGGSDEGQPVDGLGDWVELTGWSKPFTPKAAWGTEDAGLFVAGEIFQGMPTPAIQHFDGQHWELVWKADTNDGWLKDIWGSAASDVYAVGSSGRLVHFDGTAWTELRKVDDESLDGIWGSAPDDVYAVGRRGHSDTSTELALHFDGSGWTELDMGDLGSVSRIWGLSSSEVLAVGSRYPSDYPETVYLRFDGQAWSEITVEEDCCIGVSSFWASSFTDVYAFGGGWLGEDASSTRSLVMHLDGQGWDEIETSSDAVHYSVWGTSADRLLVAGRLPGGSDSHSISVIERFDGTDFTEIMRSAQISVNDIVGLSADEIYAVGPGGVLEYQP